jgi:hypothetical protein
MGEELVGQMRAIIEGVRAGLGPRSAADRARVSRRRLEAWIKLGEQGYEPFAAFTVELRAVRADAKFQILESLRELATVDARAAETYLKHREPLPPELEADYARSDPFAGLAPIAPIQTAELARAGADGAALVRMLRDPASEPATRATASVVGRLEPRKLRP